MNTKDLIMDTDELKIDKTQDNLFIPYFRFHNTNTRFTTGLKYNSIQDAFGDMLINIPFPLDLLPPNSKIK